VRVLADGQTHRQTDIDANRFYNLSHAICYSYGTDKQCNEHIPSCRRLYQLDVLAVTVTVLAHIESSQ